MKKFITVLCVCAALATASFDADAARRFGGGSSFGRSAPTFSQKAPTPGTAPLSAKQSTTQQGAAANAASRANPATAQRPSMMRSILTGMAAALGISALLSLLGINGAGMVSFVMGLLLVVAAFAAFKFFMGSRRRQQTAGTAPSAAHMPVEEPIRREEQAPAAMQAEPAQTGAAVRGGSVRGCRLQVLGTADFLLPGIAAMSLRFPTSRRTMFSSRSRISFANAATKRTSRRLSPLQMNFSALPVKAANTWQAFASSVSSRSMAKKNSLTKRGRL